MSQAPFDTPSAIGYMLIATLHAKLPAPAQQATGEGFAKMTAGNRPAMPRCVLDRDGIVHVLSSVQMDFSCIHYFLSSRIATRVEH
jgi:hypothetical protein